MTSAKRVYSLDAFRGFTMIWMFSEGFGLRALKDQPFWGTVAEWFEHADWHAVTPWDMIQPFFMFIVGVAMPFSFSQRERPLSHVLKRCALLIFWGLIARSVQAGRPNLDLINVLAQLSVTYLLAFLLMRFKWQWQAAGAVALLAIHYGLYVFTGFPDPWAKGNNFGQWFDMLVLGKNWGGNYATINCISSAFNTIAGMMAGEWLKRRGIGLLVTMGGILTVIGLAMDPWIPLIKKIWTPSFAVFSTGICLLALSAFYFVCDMKQKRSWAQIFVIVGSNSIFIYLFHEILGRWLRQTAPTFTGWSIQWWGAWGQVFTACVLVAFQIWVCVWLWRRKIFFKL